MKAEDSTELSDFGADAQHDSARGPLARVCYWIGGGGLLLATAADTIAVAGRHAGLPLLGSIEIVQLAVVLLAGTSMLVATLVGGHATVHLLTERMPPQLAGPFARIAALFSALAFILVAYGSGWILGELWNAFEQTELLHIPLRWLRLLWTVIALLIVARFLQIAFGRNAR